MSRRWLAIPSLVALFLAIVLSTGFAGAQSSATGSISGRVIDQANPSEDHSYSLLVVPAHEPQPLGTSQAFAFKVPTDTSGRFAVQGLADGDYLVALSVEEAEYVTPMPERVSFQSPSGEQTWPAIRLVVSKGQAVESVNIVIRIPDIVVVDPPPTPRPAVVAEPGGFFGSVTIDGQPAASGTVIEALIGDTICGRTTTADGAYEIVVKAGFGMGNDFQEGCAGSGPNTSNVAFRSGNLLANETGAFIPGGQYRLDLTFGTTPSLPSTGSGPPRSNAGVSWLGAIILVVIGCTLAGRATCHRSSRSD